MTGVVHYLGSSLRIFLFPALLLIITSNVYGQTTPYPADHALFIDRIVKELKDLKQDRPKRTAELFEANYKQGKLSAAQLDATIKLANQMQQNRMRTSPHYENLVRALNESVNFALTEQKFLEWTGMLSSILSDSKTGDSRLFMKYLDFSIGFFSTGHFYSSPTKSWTTNKKDFTWGYQNGTPFIEYKDIDLLGFTSGDSTYIYNTSGIYYPFEEKWVGDKGKVTWESVGLDRNVNATFGQYQLDVTKSDYTIDTVTFTYPTLLEKPVQGRLENKLLINKTTTQPKHPAFRSFQLAFQMKDIVPGVNYQGGFEINGASIYGAGSKEEPAELHFFSAKTGDLVAKARSNYFNIEKKDRISTNQAEIIIYFKEDSIYHPGLTLRYEVPVRKLTASTGRAGITKAAFYDSYHKIEMKVERLVWQIDQPVVDLQMVAAGDETEAFFSSYALFEQRKFDEYKNVVGYHPIASLKKASEMARSREIPAQAVAKAFHPNLSVEQIKGTLYQMMEDGFIYYDNETDMVTVLDKTFNYVWGNAKIIDYDIIKIKSKAKGVNAQIDLDKQELNVGGVYSVALSAVQFVHIFPKGQMLKVHKNRDMEFGGTVFGGRLDFYGNDFYFNYDRFDIEMLNVDSMAINVPTDRKDEYGAPIMTPVRTVLEKLTGRLYIDLQNNKSGKEEMPEYPKFENRKSSYAYYDKNSAFPGAYQRDKFYFEVDPFTMDSLDNFSIYTQELEGTLYSAGIFPPFKEKLTVREDLSLGFLSKTPAEGRPLYGGKGTYYNTIDLSNKGFKGDGKFEFLASTSTANGILFFPDSLNANVDEFVMKEQKMGGVGFPNVSNTGVKVHWEPTQDSMVVSRGENLFNFFNNYATLDGNLVLTSKGTRGAGLFDWADASLASRDFVFGEFSVNADTSELKIKAFDKTQVAFKLPNVKSTVDFEKKWGNFKSNERHIPTELPYNRYQTTMNEFDWDMAKRQIFFKPPSDREYSIFSSLHPQQHNLNFLAKGGTYDLTNYVLNAHEVPYIAVADAHIIPGDGEVFIEGDAKMRQLQKAKIIADSTSKWFVIYDAVVDVGSKKRYDAKGKYDYVNRSGQAQVMNFYEIGVAGRDTLSSYGKSIVTDSAVLQLDPKILFKGEVEFASTDPELKFKGYSKLLVPEDSIVLTDWFFIDDRVDAKDVEIYAGYTRTFNGDSAYSGIHLRTDSTNLYTTLLGAKNYRRDNTVFRADGFVYYDADTKEFLVEERNSKDEVIRQLSYNEASGEIKGSGPTTLGLDLETIMMDAFGEFNKKRQDTTYYTSLTVALDYFITSEVINMMAADIESYSFDAPAIDYTSEAFISKMKKLINNEKAAEKFVNELNKTGTIVFPAEKSYELLLTNVDMIWDESSGSFHTTGQPLSLVTVGSKTIGKQLKGWAEFGMRRQGDFFNIYIETPYKDWYFITYQSNQLQILSSNVHFNDMLMDLDPDKRRMKTASGKFITFSVSNPRKKQSFVERMEFYQNN